MIRRRELYQSSNGDRWELAHDTEGGEVFVLHQPNLASGGRASNIPIAAFLARGAGPEQQALLRLIASLAQGETETA